jgi:hypothetical protein
MTDADVEELRAALLDAAGKENADPGSSDEYGNRYTVDFELRRGKRAAIIRSCWIVRTGKTSPRFVTC